MRQVAAYLGHTTLKPTMVYLHLTEVSEEKARAALATLPGITEEKPCPWIWQTSSRSIGRTTPVPTANTSAAHITRRSHASSRAAPRAGRAALPLRGLQEAPLRLPQLQPPQLHPMRITRAGGWTSQQEPNYCQSRTSWSPSHCHPSYARPASPIPGKCTASSSRLAPQPCAT